MACSQRGGKGNVSSHRKLRLDTKANNDFEIYSVGEKIEQTKKQSRLHIWEGSPLANETFRKLLLKLMCERARHGGTHL